MVLITQTCDPFEIKIKKNLKKIDLPDGHCQAAFEYGIRNRGICILPETKKYDS